MGVQQGREFGRGAALPAGAFGLGDREQAHSLTSVSVNQPAFSSSRRASSAVKCP
jgi:hypothetical protein